jgi:hypothetical protein
MLAPAAQDFKAVTNHAGARALHSKYAIRAMVKASAILLDGAPFAQMDHAGAWHSSAAMRRMPACCECMHDAAPSALTSTNLAVRCGGEPAAWCAKHVVNPLRGCRHPRTSLGWMPAPLHAMQ